MPAPTPSQTVGPFYGYALPFAGGGDIAPAGHLDTITVHGCVRDGDGAPVPDALLEFWQPAGRPGAQRPGAPSPGSLRRNGVDFTGFGRVATDADGRWVVRTLPPRAQTPYLSVCVFARGLTHHLFTRAYIGEPPAEALPPAVPQERRGTLLAVPDGERTYRFDIHLQGEKETVFLDFRG